MTLHPPRATHAALIGRASEVDSAVSALRGGSGVAFVGSEGVGKTAVARELAARLDPRRTCVVWLTATDAGRQVPFGVLAALMPASSCAEVTVVLPAVREALAARAAGRRLVLVVDDAHLLDGPSAAVLLGLSGQVQLVVTLCAGAAQPDAVRTLWKDGYLQRVDLEPFGEADTARLAAALVGGDVAAPTVQILHQWTRGNALYLTELVRAGLADGALREHAGLWWWQAPLLVPPTLTDLLDRELDRLDTPARDALAAVALGAPLPVDALERIVAPEVVVRLEDRGLLHAEAADGGLLLRFAHPMVGAAVRRRLSPARQRRIAAVLLAAHPGEPAHPTQTVLTALWQIDAGVRVDGDRLLDAADLVLHSDAALSLRLAEAAGRDQPAARVGIARASALVELGRPDEARTVLEKASADADDPADDIQIAIALAGHRAWTERDPAGGLDELATLLERTGDPSARADIRSVRALVLLFGGHTGEALRAAESVLADGAADHRSRLRARLAQAAALSLVGRTADALRVATRTAADCADDTARLPYARGMAIAAMALAQIWRSPTPDVPATHPRSGRWPTPADGEIAELEPTSWPLLDGYGRRLAGDLPGAIRYLRASLVQQSGGEGLFRSEAAAWLVLCLAEAGSVDEAERVLHSTPPDAMAVVPGLWPWAAAAIAAARGERSRAIELMAEASAAARRSECWLVELGYLIYEADIRGTRDAATVAPRLRAVLGHVDAPRLVAVARATLAAVSASPVADHVDRLERLNLPRQARRVVALAAAPEARPDALTVREREVAALAAGGLTDREIAERLVLSVRTVESHLARVYRKLAVTSRRQLDGALRRWSGAGPRDVAQYRSIR